VPRFVKFELSRDAQSSSNASNRGFRLPCRLRACECTKGHYENARGRRAAATSPSSEATFTPLITRLSAAWPSFIGALAACSRSVSDGGRCYPAHCGKRGMVPRHPEGRACVQARPFCFDREWLPGFLRGSNLQKACKRVLGDRWYPRLRRRMQREAQNRTSRRSLMSPVTQDIGRPSAGATKCRSGSSAGNGARMPRRS
jgi:hypothetical protein